MKQQCSLTENEKLLIEMGDKFQCDECGSLVDKSMTSLYDCPRCRNRVCQQCIVKHRAAGTAIVCPVCGTVFERAKKPENTA